MKVAHEKAVGGAASDVKASDKNTECGVDWTMIVHAAMLLHSIDAMMWGGDGDDPNTCTGPLDIMSTSADHTARSSPPPRRRTPPDVVCHTLPEEVATFDAARDAIFSYFTPLQRPTVVIVTPACSRFPDFDGFVCYWQSETQPVRIIGYHANLNRMYPKRDAPDWMEGGVVIRGRPASVAESLTTAATLNPAATTSTTSAGVTVTGKRTSAAAFASADYSLTQTEGGEPLGRNWRFLSEEKLKKLLGVSLARLSPGPL